MEILSLMPIHSQIPFYRTSPRTYCKNELSIDPLQQIECAHHKLVIVGTKDALTRKELPRADALSSGWLR